MGTTFKFIPELADKIPQGKKLQFNASFNLCDHVPFNGQNVSRGHLSLLHNMFS